MNIRSTINGAFLPKITERDPGRQKITSGLENVAVNTTGDNVDPDNTFVVFKKTATEGFDPDGVPVIQVSDLEKDAQGPYIRKGWIPKEAFQDLGDAYYLPTYQYSTTSAMIGGASRGLVSAGVPGAIAGLSSGLVAGKFGDSTVAKFGVGAAAGVAALTAYQAAFHGNIGLSSALFAGGVTGLVAAAAGDGDASVRDAMLGGSAAGLVASMTTGMPLAVLTSSAATAVGAQVDNRAGQVLISAGLGAALTATQALIAGNSVPLAAGIGAAMAGVGALVGPELGQASRNLQASVEPYVAKGMGKLLKGRGDTTFQVVSALPPALALGTLGSSLGLVAPGLGPVGAVIGAAVGGATAYQAAGKRIAGLKKLQAQRMLNLEKKQDGKDENTQKPLSH